MLPTLEGVISRRVLLNFRLDVVMRGIPREWHELADVPEMAGLSAI